MNSSLSTLSYILDIPNRFRGDEYVTTFADYGDIILYCSVLYVILVWVAPTQVMQHRPAFDLRLLLILWNFMLTVFSTLGAISCTHGLLLLLRTQGFYDTTCFFKKDIRYNGELGFWLYAFIISKIPEMLDTVFLVLQKKPVIFLHWYHHLTVMLFCWHAGYTFNPSGLWFAAMNYSVHSVMYFYYFACACGYRRVVRPVAPFITTLQILQMVVGTFIVCYTAFHQHISGRGCGVDPINIRIGLVMYLSYLFLFVMFFFGAYSRQRPSKSVTGGVAKLNEYKK
uniref:Elongation of fatty acids protein n=1 Tax=Trypanosoma vivax (strain Y486) TaxID=1055687 RepID=G0TYN6_TRYVY|nr:putative long chain fatty acyl elongase [Trypanosoma vivax Y486]